MIEGFEDKEAFARFNFIIDKVRGNGPFCTWGNLSDEEKQMYMDEAEVAEYVITKEDCRDIEDKINTLLCKFKV
jgi:hypothetical protein